MFLEVQSSLIRILLTLRGNVTNELLPEQCVANYLTSSCERLYGLVHLCFHFERISKKQKRITARAEKILLHRYCLSPPEHILVLLTINVQWLWRWLHFFFRWLHYTLFSLLKKAEFGSFWPNFEGLLVHWHYKLCWLLYYTNKENLFSYYSETIRLLASKES